MPSKSDWQTAFAVCAAIIGAGFASGREIVSFFSCFGAASFLGIAAASAGVGALVYAILLLTRRTHSATFPGLYGALMGEPCKDAVSVLYGLLCLVTASAMLSAGAELGALAFPIHRAYELGFFLTLLAALAAVCRGFHSLSLMGALLFPMTAVYFGIMAFDGRYPVRFEPADLLPALPMGLIYASFNGALAAGAICTSGRSEASPARAAYLTAFLLFLLLTLADCAMLRSGNTVMQMSLPSVALAAEWGVVGYYSSIVVLWLSCLSTLCAMLHSAAAQLTDAGFSKPLSLLVSALAAALIAVCGFQTLVDAVYPLLGWVCGFALVALTLFLPTKNEES